MKPRLFLALALILLLGLCACGHGAEDSSDPAPPQFSPLDDRTLAPLSLEESRQMACFLNANRALLQDGRLFCYDFDANWEPVLASYTWADGKLGAFTVLARGCVPEYLCREDGYLYYLDRGSGAIERVADSGGQRECLREGPCDFLSLRNGRLYFCDEQGRVRAMNPDGSGESLLLDRPCAYAYPLGEVILYQALDDGGRLHLYGTGDGVDRLLSSAPGYAPLLVGDRLWYAGEDGLHSVGLDGLGATLYPLPPLDSPPELLPGEDGLTVRGMGDADGISQWVGPPEGPFQSLARGYRICDWLGNGAQVDTVYEPDGRIRCFLLTDGAGNSISFIAGRTS